MESCISTSPLLLPVSSKTQSEVHVKGTRSNIVRVPPLPYDIRKGELQTSTFQSSSRHIVCAAASNAKCAASASASATVTLERNDTKIIVTPDKKREPVIDDNGGGFPPRDDPGNGGNGGGGGKFSGGLTLMGVLGVLDILKDVETEWRKKDRRSFELEN